MVWNTFFFINSFFLGVGLAMDAFSVSLVNGLNEPYMKKSKVTLIAFIFAVFQALMPITGWFFVSKLIDIFTIFHKIVPYISLILLLFIGSKMIYEGIKEVHLKKNNSEISGTQNYENKLTFNILIIQGIATSLDALSVGFTFAEYNLPMVITASGIIAFVTFIICYIGVILGKKVGTKLSVKATIFGGCILVLIGIEIFIKKGLIQ